MIEFVIFIVVAVVVLLVSSICIVTVNHVVVYATFGSRFTRILKEGFNLIILPWEWPLNYDWTYTDQQYKTHHVRGTELRVAGTTTIDLVPIECETTDNRTVSVDMLLMYRVVDPKKAMFGTHDPLNLLCQQVIKHVRYIVSKINCKDLKQSETDIGEDVCKRIVRDWTPLYGLALESCEIQCISFDEDTLRRRRQFRDGLSPLERSRIEQAHALPSASSSRNVVML
jgi:regulator of protease activity HflC (stomatin/prohibitin superfamily)